MSDKEKTPEESGGNISSKSDSSITSRSGGIDLNVTSGSIAIGSDVVGRDKVVSVYNYYGNIATGETTTQYNLTKLRQQLVEYFDSNELRDICFDLQIDYDNLQGEGKAAKARELISFLKRTERIPDLVKLCKKERPKVDWGKIKLGDRYYINNNANDTVIVSRVSENQYIVESPNVWDGVGIFDGNIYFGIFRYKDNLGKFAGVWGIHRGEIQPDESLNIHGTNMIKAKGEFDVVWNKA